MFKTACSFALLLAAIAISTGCEVFTYTSASSSKPLAVADDEEGFVSLFNGEDLTGWTPKIRGQEFGEDPKKTYRVKDGAIQVRYENYDKFDRQFGHLFLDKIDYSHYILRLEYRFLGDKQIDGHPGGWAYMNSGVMIHGEDPKKMGKDKDFPDSIEVQLLGQKEGGPNRTTANICTPGTHYVLDGKLMKGHCKNSSSKTFRGEQWVNLEIEVHGSKKIIHRVNGETVFEYTDPQLNNGTLLEKGSISLQSESHECDFRNIRIKVLEK
ncbi:MAG: 3-keto-disaccharide hydrolase [Phycisphaeraceae bacterium]